jgi:hypothetical protein
MRRRTNKPSIHENLQVRDSTQRQPNSKLCFVLPDGGRVPAHAEITEASGRSLNASDA